MHGQAFFLQAFGICLLIANWFVTLCAAALAAALMYRTPLEERNLIRKYGQQYEDLMRQTGRYQ